MYFRIGPGPDQVILVRKWLAWSGERLAWARWPAYTWVVGLSGSRRVLRISPYNVTGYINHCSLSGTDCFLYDYDDRDAFHVVWWSPSKWANMAWICQYFCRYHKMDVASGQHTYQLNRLLHVTWNISLFRDITKACVASNVALWSVIVLHT